MSTLASMPDDKLFGYSDVEPLLAALSDPVVSVRVAALRAVVRLPLTREVWFEVSRHILDLLSIEPDDQIGKSQTDRSVLRREALRAAVYVPSRAVRAILLQQVIADLGNPSALLRSQAAEYLSIIDATPVKEMIREAWQKITDDYVRFWLALALARQGEPEPIEIVFKEIDRGDIHLPNLKWRSAPAVIWVEQQMEGRRSLPESIEALFHRIAADKKHGAHDIVQWLLQGYKESAVQPAQETEPDISDVPDDLRREAEELAATYFERPPLGPNPISGELDLHFDYQELSYLSPETATRLVSTMFAYVVAQLLQGTLSHSIANGIVYLVYVLKSRFVPDVPGLFESYLALQLEEPTWQSWPLDEIQDVSESYLPDVIGGKVTIPQGPAEIVRWQLAWTISRAGLRRVLSDLAPGMTAGNEAERVAAARLIAEAALYVQEVEPPQFGGGRGGGPGGVGGPAEFLPQSDLLLEEEEFFHQGAVSAKPPPRDDSGTTLESNLQRRRTRKRVVNTGFAPLYRADEPLDPTMPLQSGQHYYFWLQVGRRLARTMETTPTSLPTLPAKARLTVAVFGFKDELEITRGADVGELEIREDGKVEVVRQPTEFLPKSRKLKRCLFFPVKVPDRAATYRMRCNLYWGQILLQSRLIFARAMAQPRQTTRGEKPLRSVLDYTLSQTLDPAHLARLQPHRLSVLLNRNADGTHSFHFYGADGGKSFKNDDVRFGEGELQNLIDDARGTLRLASWGDTRLWEENSNFDYRYVDGKRDLARLQADLTNFAKWGYLFYDKVITRMAGEEEQVADLEVLMATPGLVQIAMKESPAYVLPAALIYDYPLDHWLQVKQITALSRANFREN